MAGCSAGDSVGHEAALSRMVAAGAEGADPTFDFRLVRNVFGACSLCRFQSPRLGQRRDTGHTHQEQPGHVSASVPACSEHFCCGWITEGGSGKAWSGTAGS